MTTHEYKAIGTAVQSSSWDDSLKLLQGKVAARITSGVANIDWSDEFFQKNYLSKFKKPKARMENDKIKEYFKLFTVWVLTGELSNAKLLDMITAFFYSAKLGGQYLVDASYLDAPGGRDWTTWTVNENKYTSKLSGEYLFYSEVGDSASARSYKYKTKNSEGNASFSQDDLETWETFIKKYINAPVTETEDGVSALATYFAFYGLYLIRLITKPVTSVNQQLLVLTSCNFMKFYTTSESWPVTPPIGNKSIVSATHLSHNNNPDFAPFLALLIDIRLAALLANNHQTGGFLTAGCLQTLGDTGLGLHHWLEQAADQYSMPVCDLLETIAFDKFKHNVDNYLRFLQHYGSDTLQRTWPWARVFHPGALSYLSTRENYNLVIFCALVISCNNLAHPIWSAFQFQFTNREAKIDEIRSFAITFMKMNSDVTTSTPRSDKAVLFKDYFVKHEKEIAHATTTEPLTIITESSPIFNPPPAVDDAFSLFNES